MAKLPRARVGRLSLEALDYALASVFTIGILLAAPPVLLADVLVQPPQPAILSDASMFWLLAGALGLGLAVLAALGLWGVSLLASRSDHGTPNNAEPPADAPPTDARSR